MEIPAEEHCNEYFQLLSVTVQLKNFRTALDGGMVTVDFFEWGQSGGKKKIRLYNTLKAKHRQYTSVNCRRGIPRDRGVALSGMPTDQIRHFAAK